MNPAYRPASLLLQWHLSDACNLRCTHCYQVEFELDQADPGCALAGPTRLTHVRIPIHSA